MRPGGKIPTGLRYTWWSTRGWALPRRVAVLIACTRRVRGTMLGYRLITWGCAPARRLM